MIETATDNKTISADRHELKQGDNGGRNCPRVDVDPNGNDTLLPFVVGRIVAHFVYPLALAGLQGGHPSLPQT